jgi:hypothetical protein
MTLGGETLFLEGVEGVVLEELKLSRPNSDRKWSNLPSTANVAEVKIQPQLLPSICPKKVSLISNGVW